MKAQFESEFKFIEDNVDLTLKAIDRPKMKMALDDQTTILRALYACHDGVVRYIPAYPNVVETSSNLAIIDIEDGKAAVKILARSAREDMKDYIVKMLMTCFHLADFKVETGGDYIGWDPNPDSEALHMLLDLYKKLFNEEGIVQVDHCRPGVLHHPGQVPAHGRRELRPHPAQPAHHHRARLHPRSRALLETARQGPRGGSREEIIKYCFFHNLITAASRDGSCGNYFCTRHPKSIRQARRSTVSMAWE